MVAHVTATDQLYFFNVKEKCQSSLNCHLEVFCCEQMNLFLTDAGFRISIVHSHYLWIIKINIHLNEKNGEKCLYEKPKNKILCLENWWWKINHFNSIPTLVSSSLPSHFFFLLGLFKQLTDELELLVLFAYWKNMIF